MQLPPELRAAIDAEADRFAPRELETAAAALSFDYRDNDGRGRHFSMTPALAAAYAVCRMPATYSAVRRALELCGAALRESATALDIGSGTGAALWALRDALGRPAQALALERDGHMLRLGAALMAGTPLADATERINADALSSLPEGRFDIVTATYALNEQSDEDRLRLACALWARTDHTLLIVEPGTPSNFSALKSVRAALTAAGAQILAPCPHSGECPLPPDDWCHFTVRVERSALHRRLKGGSAPYEDEKFCFIAATRGEAEPCAARVLRHPQIAAGRVELALCTPNGIERRAVTKRDGPLFKLARKSNAGDAFETGLSHAE